MRRRGTFESTSSRFGWDDEKVRRPLIVFEAENRAQHRRQIESLESILGAVLLPVNIVLNGGPFNLLATLGLRKRLRFHSALALPGDESKFLEHVSNLDQRKSLGSDPCALLECPYLHTSTSSSTTILPGHWTDKLWTGFNLNFIHEVIL
jgi:hypothetical protein